MSFRQKATLLFVAVSLVGALSVSAAFLQRSSAMNVELALSSSWNTFFVIRDSVSSGCIPLQGITIRSTRKMWGCTSCRTGTYMFIKGFSFN